MVKIKKVSVKMFPFIGRPTFSDLSGPGYVRSSDEVTSNVLI
jgi:hypothetical protein